MINLVKNYKGDKGFLTVAIDTETTNYFRLAYAWALSVKITQRTYNKTAVITTQQTLDANPKGWRKLFDEIIIVDDWGMDQEWQVRNLSPWRETIKTDCDMLMTSDLYLWWLTAHNRRRSVLFSTRPMTYWNSPITSRAHRKLFDVNNLPDIYTALYYFKDDVKSAEFFETVKEVSDGWDRLATRFLKGNDNPAPRDDEIFAIATMIHDATNHTLPGEFNYNIVHMRNQLQELSEEEPWSKQCLFEISREGRIWVGCYKQFFPLHYIDKELITDNVINQLRSHYKKFTGRN